MVRDITFASLPTRKTFIGRGVPNVTVGNEAPSSYERAPTGSSLGGGVTEEDEDGTSSKEASPDIVIGEVASLSGGTAAWGKAQNDGVKMAVEEINAAGGLLGKKVKLLTEDDQSKDGEAATVTKKLVSRDKVVAVIGEIASKKSLEMAPICQKAGIPMISPGSTNPKVTEIGDNIFRVCFIDPFQGTTTSHRYGQSRQSISWALDSSAAGYYAPVMITQGGELFTFGASTASDGRQHVKLLGTNTFGFEDLLASQGSDWDFNDTKIRVSVIDVNA
jgi:hypothetical protein